MAGTSTNPHLSSRQDTRRPAPLAVNKSQAAELLGVSEDYFDDYVRPEVRIVRKGRRILVPVKELEKWLERSASLAVDLPFR